MNHQSKAFTTLRILVSLLVGLGFLIPPQLSSQAANNSLPNSEETTPLIRFGSSWKYLDNGSDQGTAWTATSFDDSNWKSGEAELGYGDGDEKTIVSYGSNAKQKYPTTYFRQAFSLDNAASVTALKVKLVRDDGAVVYLNGTEVYRSNMPSGTINYKTFSSDASSDPNVETTIPTSNLVNGTNVIAVEIHQTTLYSSDLSFDLKLIATINPQAPSNTNPTATATISPTGTASVVPSQTVTATSTAQPTVAPTTTAQPTIAPTATAQPTAVVTTGNAWYVTPNGSSSGSGSSSSPWSLAKALSHPSSVKPGDTIWLRAGTYGSGGDNPFDSNLTGASGQYITVRAYPGEKVVINGGIFIKKPYVIFWGLEVLNTNTIRTTSESGSFADDNRSDGFGVYASNVKLINNIVHDTNGIGAWEVAENVEVYGNVVYNSGWKGPDRGHGHGLYMQNNNGTKTVVDNIIFNNFSGYNIHVYTESAHIQGFNFEGNVSLNGEILVGGLQPAARINFTNNTSYNGRARFGYSSSVSNVDLTLKNNTFYNANANVLEVKRWKTLSISGNTLWSPSYKDVAFTNLSGHGTYSWNGNTYYASASSPFSVDGSSKSWSTWRSSTGFDSSSAFTGGTPSGTNIVLRPNKYETKRGNILAYNWSRANTISVDLAQFGFQSGDTYVIHNALNYAETIKGTYNGSPVSIPMTGWTVAKPNGYSSTLGSSSFPLFGAFVVGTN